MDELKEEIQQGVYRVDTQAVADAILRRVSAFAAVSTAAASLTFAQNECS